MRVFVTGVSGFVGSHLAAELLDSGHELFGIARTISTRSLQALCAGHREVFDSGALEPCDVRDGARLRAILRAARPDAVVHLAGIAFAPRAAREPRLAYEVNLLGGIELLDAVRDAAPGARVLFPTSGEVYGWMEPDELPLTEDQPLRPTSPYSVGKAAADLAAFQQFFRHDLDVVRVRPFNHTGPWQSPDFVCPEFARAIAAAERGRAETVLRTGNLDVERDFSDVRDVVRGYLALLAKGAAGEVYNLAAGRSVTVRSVLDGLLAASTARVRVETDPGKVRAKELPAIRVSIEKIRARTGWAPEIPLERTLAELLEWWRKELR